MSGRLIIIASPSGGGKTSIINELMRRHPELIHSISWTTRPARPGRIDEGYYKIVTREEFEMGIKDGIFAEWAEVHGHLYGTPKAPVEEAISQGKYMLLDLDVVGSMRLRNIYGNAAVAIFVMPPSIDVLKERLIGRATDSAEEQAKRLANAMREIEAKDMFDFVVVNDDIGKACDEIEEIIFRKK